MAKHYWISYRIHENSTYEKRYNALRDEISNQSNREWRESTSFHLISADADIDPLAKSLKSTIDPSVDRIVIRRLNERIARYIGKFNDEDGLLFFMGYATRV